MDQPIPLETFRLIETGASWDDCWIWHGEMTKKRPLAYIGGKQVWMRSYVRRIFHPQYKHPHRVKCDVRCVHPDHAVGIRRQSLTAPLTKRRAA